MTNTIFKGIPASPGYARGKVVLLSQTSGHFSYNSDISSEKIESEVSRFQTARKNYALYLDQQLETFHRNEQTVAAEIVDAYRELIDDEELENDIIAVIQKECKSAETAVEIVLDQIMLEMSDITDEYARQRIDDIRSLKSELILALQEKLLSQDSNRTDSDFILVGSEISPTEIASINHEHLLGIVSETGGKTSHLAILARNLEIPAILGVSGICEELKNNDFVILDGFSGQIVLSPDSSTVDSYQTKQNEYHKTLALLNQTKNVSSLTRDGQPFQIWANLGDPSEIKNAKKYNASGIGLLRSEFLFGNAQSIPTEEEQFRIYRQLATQINGPIVIRTFDIGGDKPLDCFPLPAESNPFLGWRACRLYSAHTELIMPQLKAILRASSFGDIRLMFPMISSFDEAKEMLRLLEITKLELRNNQISFQEKIPVGLMIETPAAALIVKELATIVDFFSIGTNDLTQYALAVDRGNAHVASLYDYCHPAVLRLIYRIIQDAHSMQKPVGLCGELAGDELLAPFLLGAGLDEWSMSPFRIPFVKSVLIQMTLEESKHRTQNILQMKSAEEIRSYLAASLNR